jgi:NAD(P)-dependent dehydrogenase (short-subunit alcohol dehydrogenase family)
MGRGTVEALVARGAQVTVLARDRKRLSQLSARTGVAVQAGDATDAALMEALVAEVQPSALILNAGAPPVMAPIDEQSWESFCAVWNTDVKAGLYGIQAALKTPMPPGGRVLIVSGGFAIGGAPLGGGSAGAKRMLWFMAHYANERARELGLDLRFQALLPLSPPWGSGIGESVAAWYAQRQGVSVEAVQAARQDGSLPLRQWGEHVVTLLTEPDYATGVAYGISADAGPAGITLLDSQPALSPAR